MNEYFPTPENSPDGESQKLREVVLNAYITTSQGIHTHLSEAEVASYRRAYARYLRGWLRPSPGARWLDLGCGQGHLLQLARTTGYDITEGVDWSEEMLAAARAAGLNVWQGDAFEAAAAAAPESCDVVSCFDLIEHFPKGRGFILLKHIHRILKPGGILILKQPNAYSPGGAGITANDLTHEAAYTSATLLQMGRLAGFKDGEVREVGPLPHSLTGVARWLAWQAVRGVLVAIDVAETGHPRAGIYTRVFVCRLVK
jgi:2-polyprenyl-3-methyl-5-hydroxy-6-metoxy-1,4-benzoquinol methylase